MYKKYGECYEKEGLYMENKGYTVATGNINWLIKGSREVPKYVSKLEGFLGVHPMPPQGTLWIFDTENNAKIARNKMRAMGIQCGDNITEITYSLD